MKQIIYIICVLILIPLCAFAQLSTCDVSGTAYGLSGQPASGIKIRVTRVEQSGTLIRTGILETTTDEAGAWTLTIPRSSTAFFCAVGVNLVNMSACTNMTRKTIPNAATADFSSLSPATITAQNSIAITVKDEGIALATAVNTINFVGTGVAATQPSSGVATITISIGSSIFSGLGTPSNGAFMYCSNCQVTSPSDNTCTDGGTGAFAMRLAGAWRCLATQN